MSLVKGLAGLGALPEHEARSETSVFAVMLAPNGVNRHGAWSFLMASKTPR